MRTSHARLTTFLAAAAVCCSPLAGKDKHAKPDAAQPKDQIRIEAQIALTDGPVTRFVVTKHYDRSYVYAEREAGGPITLMDVTNPVHPQVLSNTTLPAASGSLLAVAGTAGLIGDASAPKITPPAQTIRIMDFSDPAHPKVTRQFDGVTAVERSGGLILLANPEGIWILSEHLALDPAVEAEYARRVVYQ